VASDRIAFLVATAISAGVATGVRIAAEATKAFTMAAQDEEKDLAGRA
jgi:hypothetical protein